MKHGGLLILVALGAVVAILFFASPTYPLGAGLWDKEEDYATNSVFFTVLFLSDDEYTWNLVATCEEYGFSGMRNATSLGMVVDGQGHKGVDSAIAHITSPSGVETGVPLPEASGYCPDFPYDFTEKGVYTVDIDVVKNGIQQTNHYLIPSEGW
jgi:hypothetical protein